MEAITTAIESMISGISDVVDFALFSIPAWAEAIVSDALMLMLVVAVPLCGIGVGMLRRLINTN